VIDGQSSVQPTTNYRPPSVTNLYTNVTDQSKHSLSTEGGEFVYIVGNDFGPLGENYLGDIKYGPSGFDYIAQNCSVIEHSIKIKCITVPGIGNRLHFVVNVLGQSSLASTAWLSYADPKISLLTKNVGPTSGELRLRIDGTNFAILDNSVQKYISWFNGDREIIVEISAQPGLDFQLLDTQDHTAAGWLAFDQPQGYGIKNDVSVILVSPTTGVQSQSEPVHFQHVAPSITRVYPEEPFDCPSSIENIHIGTYDGTYTDITIILTTPKVLTNGSKVQINDWRGSYGGVRNIETTFLSDTWTAANVELISFDSNLALVFHVRYKKYVAPSVVTLNPGVVQVRRNGIR
jgi:hypothetical protein